MNQKWTFNLVALVLIFLGKTTYAQNEISVSLGYEVPMGNLTWVYSPTTSYNVSYYNINYSRGEMDLAAGLNLGYYKFTTDKDTLNYTALSGLKAVGGFSDYTMFMLSGGLKFILEVSDDVEFAFGLDVGYYYGKFEYYIMDSNQNSRGVDIEGRFTMAPKISLGYNLSEELNLFVQGRYNLCIRLNPAIDGVPSRKLDYEGYRNFGTFEKTFSIIVGIGYRW